jgi:membrane-bound lytic murein transglycosylase
MAIGFYKLVDALPFIDMTKQIAQLEAEMDALVRTSIKPVTSAAKAMGNVTTDAFSDMSDSADDAAKKIKEIQRAIVDAKTTLEGFQKALLADDQAAAQAYVEQERKVSDLRKAIAGEDDEAQRAELQAELDRETAALNKATPQFAGALSPFVGEQRRRAGLTDFERELEDVNARRTDRIREDLPQIILNINFNDAVAGDEGIQQIIMKTIQQLNRETALGFAGR